MKTIAAFQDLEAYGIHYLTGESCSLMLRGLCDLTSRGRRIVCECFGLSPDALAENWNSGSVDNPHVASILLTREMIPTIAIFALLDSGCHTVLVADQVTYGLSGDDEFVDAPYDWESGKYTGPAKLIRHSPIRNDRCEMDWPTCYGTISRVVRNNSAQPHSGTRNIHQISGRIA